MRTHRLLAWVLAALAGVETVAAVVLAVAGRLSFGEAIDGYLVTNLAIGVGFAACGAILAVQRPGNAVGWLLLLAGIAPITTAAVMSLGFVGAQHGWPDRVVGGLLTVFNAAWPFGIGLFLPLALQLFPTGRPVTPQWRWLLWTTVVAGVLFVLSSAGTETLTMAGQEYRPSFGIRYEGWLAVAWYVANAAPLVGIVGAIVALVVRYRRGDERLRRQLLWLVLAIIAMLAVNLPRFIDGTGPILLLLAFPLIPIAITIAILRHQLLDIRLALSRTVLYLLLTVAVAAAYLGLVAAFDALLRGIGAPVLATLVIALVFNPVRVRLQRAVDRLFYGARSDPMQAVSRVGERLAADDLTGVLAGARDALRLPFAALRRDGRELAASGEPPAILHTVPLVFRGERAGELIVGVRRGERRLATADLTILDLLAAPLAAALHATALADDVQSARERLVAAREEERRRLHRDLHDGLGPALTGAAFKADAARNRLAGSPDEAGALIDQVRVDIREAIDDVRRLVYGLRPPALDELGLAAALRRHGDALPVSVTVDAPDRLPSLPAAVEVAAYRIATEALTNVARHSGAGTARVELRIDSAVRLSIVDDGAPDRHWTPGVGLTSIRERVAELGGTCTAGPTASGGRVDAVLPLVVPA
jgi:two-component system NarL family sensor kinase